MIKPARPGETVVRPRVWHRSDGYDYEECPKCKGRVLNILDMDMQHPDDPNRARYRCERCNHRWG